MYHAYVNVRIGNRIVKNAKLHPYRYVRIITCTENYDFTSLVEKKTRKCVVHILYRTIIEQLHKNDYYTRAGMCNEMRKKRAMRN